MSCGDGPPLPIPGITSLKSLQLLDVSAGQHLVVMGATGGVGGYAVQMARALGAHVVATVRGNSDEARRLGAEDVYDTTTVDMFDAIQAAYPDGVDAVLDIVNGKDAIRGDTKILKPQGRLVSTLYSADEQWFAKRQITAYDISSLTNSLSSPQGLTEVAHMLADGTITTRIHSDFALDDASEMFEKLRDGRLSGKTVIRV